MLKMDAFCNVVHLPVVVNIANEVIWDGADLAEVAEIKIG
jgi:hypothetical protein